MLWAYFKSELLLLTRKKSYLILSIMLPLVFYLIFTALLD
ncbi:ABC transporter permease, partial [Mammaliicoccus sciuri]